MIASGSHVVSSPNGPRQTTFIEAMSLDHKRFTHLSIIATSCSSHQAQSHDVEELVQQLVNVLGGNG